MLFLPKPEENKKFKWLRILVACFFIVLAIIVATYLIFEENYKNRIYPGVRLENINLGGLTKVKAKEKIEEKINQINQNGIKFKYQEHEATITPIISSLGGELAYQIIFFDLEKTVDNIFDFGRNEGILKNLKAKIKALRKGETVKVEVEIEAEEIEKILNENYKEFEQIGQSAELFATTSKKWARKIEFTILEEQIGYKFSYKKAVEKLKDNLAKLDDSEITLDIEKDNPKIYKSECLNIEKEAQKIIAISPITILYKDKKWEIEKEILADWLMLDRGVNDKITIDLNEEKIKKYLEENIKIEIDQDAVNAKFEIKDNRVVEFNVSRDGLKLNDSKTISALRKKFLTDREVEIEAVVEVEKSKISTEDVNNLGISEIIGTGHSNFVGSPKNRIHNITTGANALSGIIIKPDEEFSLVTALGKIDKESGYLPELVIKGNKTIPEYGGGLCQIGTTMFRTALDAGLVITARRNHSYRVSYYEPAGTDATIYNPRPDFKFLNDTPNHILILYRIDGNDIYFDFWGKKDGRIVEKTDPTIYNITKPGATKIIETTDLAPGEKRCTEMPHNGADAYFDYKVTYLDGEVKEKRFESHYTPWRGVCLVGIEKLTEEEIETKTNTSTEENLSE